MRLSKAHCLEKSRGYITRQSRVREPSMEPEWSEVTIYGTLFGPGGPCLATWMVRGDHVWRLGGRGHHVWRHRWSGGTLHGGSGGSTAP